MNKILLTTLGFSLLYSSAIASGFDRGGVNVDQLFDKEGVTFSSGVSWVFPDREIRNVQRVDGTASSSKVDVDTAYFVPSLGIKIGVTDDIDCLGTYTEPFGGYTAYGTKSAYSPTAIEFSIQTRDLGLTCSYSYKLQRGNIRAIAGVSYQQLKGFQTRQLATNPFTGAPIVGSFELEGEAFGWRAGAAYEIPEIALRTSLVYSSRYNYDGLNGNVDTTALTPLIEAQYHQFNIPAGTSTNTGVAPVTASTEIPQSLEFKFQTGINEKTIVFGSVKWQDWSKLGIIPIDGVPTPGSPGSFSPTSFDPVYRDGWTVSLGAGRKLTEELSASLAVGWDRGTATVAGIQTDTWTLSGGFKYDFNENVELRIGGLVGMWTEGTSGPTGGDAANDVTYDFGDDFVGAINISTKLKF